MVMTVLLTNNARSTLLSGINALQTEIRLRAGGGNTFPTITAPGQRFPITIEDSLGNIEIMRVIARSGDVFTVKRAQEGTTAKSFSANDVVELRLTVGAMQELVSDTHTNFGRIYMTPADGVDSEIGVPAGYYFNVRSPSDDSYVDEYQNVNGVAVATSKSYPSGELTQSMSEQIDRIGSLDYLSEQLDQIAVDKGWDASFVVDGDKSQQEINAISKSVVNVVELRNLRRVKNGDTVRTLWHTEIGLGGGTYTFEALSSKLDNNGAWIASSVVAGTWVLVSDLYMETFGVTTDQVDQAPRINTALDFAFKQGVRDIGFEKPNTYYYDTDIVLEPRRLDWGNYPQNIYKFNWRFNGARLMPISKDTVGELYLCRDDINIHDLVMYGNSAKGTGSAYFDRCAINLGMPVSKDAYDDVIYRKTVQYTKFFNLAVSHYRYAVKFHTDWSTYYNEFYSPQLFTVAYGYTTVVGNTFADQLTRSNWYAPKHVFGACTFNLTNAETCHVFGGGSEFIYMPDVDNILPDNMPVAIYTADATAEHLQSVYCNFHDYDIEQAYRAAILDGSMNNWGGRVFVRKDTSGNPIAMDSTFFTGKCLNYPTRQGGQANGMLSVENFASGTTHLYMKASKSSNATAAVDVAYVADLSATVSGINVGMSGDSVSNPKFNVGNNMILQTKAIAPNVSEFTGLEILGHNGGGLSKFSFACHEPTPILRARSSTNAAVDLRIDALTVNPLVNNTRSIGSSSSKWAECYIAVPRFYPKATQVPLANGELVFELTSNTALKIKVMGSDGVVRSATLTLA
jgi:hypothetical protein